MGIEPCAQDEDVSAVIEGDDFAAGLGHIGDGEEDFTLATTGTSTRPKTASPPLLINTMPELFKNPESSKHFL